MKKQTAEIKRVQVAAWYIAWEDEMHGHRVLEAAEWANGEGVSVWNSDSSRMDLCFEDIPNLRRLLKAISKRA